MKKISECRIAVAWQGLPFYAARLIRAGIQRQKESVAVIGTLPEAPIKGLEEALGQKIIWVQPTRIRNCLWKSLGLSIPRLFFHPGFEHSVFNHLGVQVRREGGRVIAMADTRWTGSFRQLGSIIKFRLFSRKQFTGVWVPGKSGLRLFRFLGMPDSRIYTGLYGADPEIFQPSRPLWQRHKKFIFVGRYVKSKGIRLLIEAFAKFLHEFPEWKLLVFGRGNLQNLLEGRSGVEVYPFAQPQRIAQAMQESRFLIMPSREEAWGLVVHEAALCGCGLILSDRVGSREDLLDNRNEWIFKADSAEELLCRMRTAALLSKSELEKISQENGRLAKVFGPIAWGETFNKIVNRFLPER